MHQRTAEFDESFRQNGYALFQPMFSEAELAEIAADIESVPETEAVRRKERIYGMRNLLENCEAIQKLAVDQRVCRLVESFIGPSAFAVRAAFFNKTPETNWGLGWHQDRAICVEKKIETAGFQGWSQKAGVWQVQPPAELLSRMVALRIHLDDCAPENGALRVIPGSHLAGFLDGEIGTWEEKVPAVTCSVRAGGVVAMCPLILHASSRTKCASQRRVVHIEFANCSLPGELRWKWRVAPDSGSDLDSDFASSERQG